MPKSITPCFWFDGNAEEAIDFYTSLFTDSRIVAISRYGRCMRMCGVRRLRRQMGEK